MPIKQVKLPAFFSQFAVLPFLLLSGCGGGGSSVPNTTAPARSQTFANPLLKQNAADPWIIRHNGYYLFTFTTTRDIQIWKSPTIEGIGNARKVTVWRAPASGPNSRDIWAPEIHFLRGKWYIYYTATDGPDANRRLFVLEAKTDDPQGAYLQKAKLTAPGAGQDQCSLDGDVFQQSDALYLLWSGRENSSNLVQNIYIAPMSDPWTISGARVAISTPQYDWERHGGAVNEAPQALQHNGQTFVIYSASDGSTPNYCLGMVSNPGGDLLSAASWQKSATPVFSAYEGPEGHVYTVGHNSFTTSPNGSEDWIVYHGKENKENNWGGRLPRAQKFTWNADGTPSFGHPLPSGVQMPVPH